MDPVTRRNHWREVVERCLSSGLPISRWCQLNKIAPSSLYQWMAKFRKEEAELFENKNTSQWIEVTKEKLAASVALAPAKKPSVLADIEPAAKEKGANSNNAPFQNSSDIRARIGSVEMSITPGSAQADIEAVFKAAISL